MAFALTTSDDACVLRQWNDAGPRFFPVTRTGGLQERASDADYALVDVECVCWCLDLEVGALAILEHPGISCQLVHPPVEWRGCGDTP